jgi:hypothetical protein
MADSLEAIYMFAAANKKLKFTSQVIKPLKVSKLSINNVYLGKRITARSIHETRKQVEQV